MKNIERKVSIEISGKNYQLVRPNNGQLIQIEVMKHRLSGGLYSEMVFTSLVSSQNTINTIDMMAHMTVLCPRVIVDLKIDVSKLDIIDSLPLLKVYMQKVHPWITEWQNFIQEVSAFLAKDIAEDGAE
tara:strand:- start:988 stop:1374 length:387 start_codon:yes stop_codon:yes gene_type:complete